MSGVVVLIVNHRRGKRSTYNMGIVLQSCDESFRGHNREEPSTVEPQPRSDDECSWATSQHSRHDRELEQDREVPKS